MSKYNCEKCGKKLKPNELKYMSCGSYEFICNDCAEKQIPSKLMEKIADLEAKLAESEKENKRISSDNLSHSIYIDKKIERLEQQLAEKDAEIERLKYTVDFYKSYYISFKEKVIDELEKVKELCRNDMTICEDYFTIVKIFDNQIEELKKELNK